MQRSRGCCSAETRRRTPKRSWQFRARERRGPSCRPRQNVIRQDIMDGLSDRKLPPPDTQADGEVEPVRVFDAAEAAMAFLATAEGGSVMSIRRVWEALGGHLRRMRLPPSLSAGFGQLST